MSGSPRWWRKFQRNRLALAGLAILLMMTLIGLFAPWLIPYDVARQSLPDGLAGPSWAHPFGQDELGRDLFSRVLLGTQVSLKVGLFVVTLSASVGVLLGLFAGWFGGVIEDLVMRVTDVLLAFPGLLLAISLVAVLGPGINNVILAMAATGWVGYARMTRGQVLQAREYEFVTAAVALGARPSRVLFLHVLPNIVGPLLVEATFGMAAAIIGEASLSFLGLGVQPPLPSWGSILNEGKDHLLHPHVTAFAGLAIMMTTLALNVVGDGLRDALDPRTRD